MMLCKCENREKLSWRPRFRIKVLNPTEPRPHDLTIFWQEKAALVGTPEELVKGF
jgi:hypothetical protein